MGSGKPLIPLRRASLTEGSGGRNPPQGDHFVIWGEGPCRARLYFRIRRSSSGGPPGAGPRPGEEADVVRNRAKEYFSIKRTYQPKKRYRRRVHGFLKKMASPAGRRILRNRRRKRRHELTPS